MTFMENSANIPIFNILGTLFGNIPRNFIRTFSEYSGNISWECSTNIPRTYICLVGWYGYVKPKYGENAKLCYMDTNSFIVNVKK